MVSYTTIVAIVVVLILIYLSVRNKTTQAYWIKILFPAA